MNKIEMPLTEVGNGLVGGLWYAGNDIYCALDIPTGVNESELFAGKGGAWYREALWPASSTVLSRR